MQFSPNRAQSAHIGGQFTGVRQFNARVIGQIERESAALTFPPQKCPLERDSLYALDARLDLLVRIPW